MEEYGNISSGNAAFLRLRFNSSKSPQPEKDHLKWHN
jgi:hypothetical protein